ncbi:MAG: helix-hairpin-helix domain-containing protein, partial [Bacteroidota bacterium]
MRWAIPYICLILWVLLSFPEMVFAQEDDELRIDPNVQEYLENIVENTDAEFDFNAIYDRLARYQKRPLNLNKASAEELGELGLLNSRQIDALVQYRGKVGNLIAIYELQAVPYFDLASIERILPYVRVSGQVERFNVPFYRMLYEGDNQLVIRASRFLEEKRGFSPREDSTDTRYEGDEYRYFARFKHTFENRHSWGITAEKDAGEAFFGGSNPQGFDFYSAHLYYRNLGKRVKAIALGDYEIRFGQGLLLSGGFSTGKSSFVTNIKRTGRKVRPYTSFNEVIFLRGGAAHFEFGDFNLVAFGSYRTRDANITPLDTLEGFDQIPAFSSLQLTGLHRTPNEIADEGAINQLTTGASLEWKTRQSHIAANFVYTEFDAAFNRNPQPFNQFQFNSGSLVGSSLDYSFLWRNINFFG